MNELPLATLMLWFKEHSREIGGALAIGGALYLLSKLRSLKNRREKSFFRYRLNDSKDEIVQEVLYYCFFISL